MTKTILLDQLDWIKDAYPRSDVDQETVGIYAQALRSGCEFPPVLAVQRSDSYLIVDGVHRFLACKELKRKTIEVRIVRLSGVQDIYKRAVKENATNGKPFTSDERETIAARLKETLGVEEISKLLHISVDEIGFIGNVESLRNIPEKSMQTKPVLKRRIILSRVVKKGRDFQTYLNMFEVGYENCESESKKKESVRIIVAIADEIKHILRNNKRIVLWQK